MSPEINILDGELFGAEAFRRWLRSQVVECGSPGAVARKFKIKGNFLSALLAGRASIGEETAARFGFDRVDYTVFIPRKIEEEKPSDAKPA